jgi:hypothetical protein
MYQSAYGIEELSGRFSLTAKYSNSTNTDYVLIRMNYPDITEE